MTILLCNDGSVWSQGGSMWYAHGHSGRKCIGKYKMINLPVKIKKVSMGSATSIFLCENGQVWGCGYNSYGSVGLGYVTSYVESPQKIEYFDENRIFIADLEMGADNTIALDDNGCVYGSFF